MAREGTCRGHYAHTPCGTTRNGSRGGEDVESSPQRQHGDATYNTLHTSTTRRRSTSQRIALADPCRYAHTPCGMPRNGGRGGEDLGSSPHAPHGDDTYNTLDTSTERWRSTLLNGPIATAVPPWGGQAPGGTLAPAVTLTPRVGCFATMAEGARASPTLPIGRGRATTLRTIQ